MHFDLGCNQGVTTQTWTIQHTISKTTPGPSTCIKSLCISFSREGTEIFRGSRNNHISTTEESNNSIHRQRLIPVLFSISSASRTDRESCICLAKPANHELASRSQQSNASSSLTNFPCDFRLLLLLLLL